VLPHRPPFLFVDEVRVLDPERRLNEAGRHVPEHEPWTEAHLPGRPLVPGVLLIEGMAQTCGVLARHFVPTEGTERRLGVLASVGAVRFRHTVSPGADLVFRGRLKARLGGLFLFAATAEVDGVVVAEADTIGLSLGPWA